MATKTIYTSTISVPVYASWKCKKCGEINFSPGVIRYKGQKSTSSFRNSKHEEAKLEAANMAQAGWKNHALNIITDPNHHAVDVRNGLILENTYCTKCGEKPKWDNDTTYVIWWAASVVSAIISGMIAFSVITNVVAWLVFLVSLGVVICGFIIEPWYKKMMVNLPKEYTPVIGSLNAELIDYANQLGKTIPTAVESLELVMNCGVDVSPYAEGRVPSDKTSTAESGGLSVEGDEAALYGFCRKCGVKLRSDKGFCHMCGTKTIPLE